MNPPASIDELLAAVSRNADLDDAAVVTIVEGERRQESSSPRTVRVELHDRGESAGQLRWSVVASDKETGAWATGNPAATLDTALATVHWFDLDG